MCQSDFTENSCGCRRGKVNRAQCTCLLWREKKVKCLCLIRRSVDQSGKKARFWTTGRRCPFSVARSPFLVLRCPLPVARFPFSRSPILCLKVAFGSLNINSANAPLNHFDGGLLPDAYLRSPQCRISENRHHSKRLKKWLSKKTSAFLYH